MSDILERIGNRKVMSLEIKFHSDNTARLVVLNLDDGSSVSELLESVDLNSLKEGKITLGFK